jgi:hypothetical protein
MIELAGFVDFVRRLLQDFSNFVAGVPLNEIQRFRYTTRVFCFEIKKKLKLEKLAGRGDDT